MSFKIISFLLFILIINSFNVALALPGQSEEAFDNFANSNKFLRRIKQIHSQCQGLGQPNYYFETTIAGELIEYKAWIDCDNDTIASESLKLTITKMSLNHPTLISVINELYGPVVAEDLSNAEFICDNTAQGYNLKTTYYCYQGKMYGYIIANYSNGNSRIDILTLSTFEKNIDAVKTDSYMEF